MSEDNIAPEPAAAGETRKEGIPQEDPYPKMILVCGGIFVVLLIVIFGFIAFDFTLRLRHNVRPVPTPESIPAPEAPS